MYRFMKPVLVSLTCWLVLPLTPDVRCMDRQEIIATMNELLANPGWELMNVTVKERATNNAIVSGKLCEKVKPNPAVTMDNVYEKLRLMSLVLSCKYAELVLAYVETIRLILVECHDNTTSLVTKWNCYSTILGKIKKIQPLLVNMLTAVQKVNHMDVDLTVPKFEDDLSTMIMEMEVLYTDHTSFEKKLQPNTVVRYDLLGNTYTSFMTKFDHYSVWMIDFLDDFCYPRLVPNRKMFERHYENSQPSFKEPTDLCDFLASEIDDSIDKNIKQFHTNLGFQ